jgi:hypothetical protein
MGFFVYLVVLLGASVFFGVFFSVFPLTCDSAYSAIKIFMCAF